MTLPLDPMDPAALTALKQTAGGPLTYNQERQEGKKEDITQQDFKSLGVSGMQNQEVTLVML